MNKQFFQRVFLIILVVMGVGFSVGTVVTTVRAQSNIDIIERWAWNDVIGWIDFRYVENPNVTVTSSEIRGYASSSVGFIALHCDPLYGPPGTSCSPVNYKVTNTNGTLSGWAWSDQIGWVSFNCNNTGIGDTCATADYSVTITNGQFLGWAWNDIIGWISFSDQNDHDPDTPGIQPSPISYSVDTDWGTGPTTGTLDSSIFDTGEVDGVALNTIMWQGTLNGGDVKFQIASSNSSSGPWNFIGPDGTGLTFYGSGVGSGTQIAIETTDHNNKRYFRYRVALDSDVGGTQSPTVNDIIVSYSP